MAEETISPRRSSWGFDSGETENWKDSALCSQTDPDAFLPEKGGSTREAKRICGSPEKPNCPVREQCLAYALEHDERFGIFGGLSERERSKLKGKPAKQKRREAGCGTAAGARAHWRRGERACDACNRASTLASQLRREARARG